jgi:hypothetical protein
LNTESKNQVTLDELTPIPLAQDQFSLKTIDWVFVPAATREKCCSVTLYESFVTEANLTPRAVNPCKSADPNSQIEPPLLKNRSNAEGGFKNLKSVGVP